MSIRNRRRVIQGALFFALMFLYLGVHAYFAFVDVGSYDGWFGEQKVPGAPVLITGSDPEGPAKALRAGDVLIAINGITAADNIDVVGMSARVAPGTTYVMTIRRDGQEMAIPITTVTKVKVRNNLGERIYIWIHLLFLVTALTVFILKSDDEHARLLALLLGTFIGLSSWNMPVGLLGPGIALLVAIAKILSLWSLPLFVRFFLNFPARSPILKFWPGVERYLSLPFYLFVLPVFGAGRLPGNLRNSFFSLPPIQWMSNHGWFGLPMPIVVGYLTAGLVCLVVNYRAADRDARRRLRVVVFGSGVGFLAYLLAVAGEYFRLGSRAPRIAEWVQIGMLAALPFIPLSFAYAIIRHKVIPISLIIRRSARYVLVSRGSAVLLMAAVCVVMFFLMDSVFTYALPVSGRMVGILSAVFAIIVWNLSYSFHQRMIAPLIDRRFFREAYDARQILSELSHSVRSTTDIQELLELVATRIQTALHVENVNVLLRDEESGAFANSVAFDHRSGDRALRVTSRNRISLSLHAAVIERLNETGEPVSTDLSDRSSWLAQRLASTEGASAADERESLKRLNSAILLPLTAKGGMLGVLSLGPRLGDQPFSREDQQMLMSVVAQTTFAIENTRLIERMIEEERRRQVLEADNEQRARELEEARQLQMSMLPRSVPQLPDLEIAAYMKTATEVGGDYYDFHLGDDGTLTVAVGDATGHGLRAGTMVTAAKSLFEAFAQQPDVIQILEQSSRALKRMNLRSLFMAMTMVKVKNGKLTVSIAGMPPVLIYRAASGSVEEIAIGAMPLGSITNYAYKAREVSIEGGDVVVIMSDGLPERFNFENEMLDYASTSRAFAESASQSAQAIIEHLVKTGEAWANGRPQDDDVTFVVIKVKKGERP
ncbi:MAG: SpoIIE family protein phosphatase [Acidobacteriota bacterium]